MTMNDSCRGDDCWQRVGWHRTEHATHTLLPTPLTCLILMRIFNNQNFLTFSPILILINNYHLFFYPIHSPPKQLQDAQLFASSHNLCANTRATQQSQLGPQQRSKRSLVPAAVLKLLLQHRMTDFPYENVSLARPLAEYSLRPLISSRIHPFYSNITLKINWATKWAATQSVSPRPRSCISRSFDQRKVLSDKRAHLMHLSLLDADHSFQEGGRHTPHLSLHLLLVDVYAFAPYVASPLGKPTRIKRPFQAL